MSKQTKAQQAEQEEARNELRAILTPGTDVYTTVKSVSKSGMSRRISVYVMRPDPSTPGQSYPRDISRLTALATGFTFDADAYALKVGGAGMDMTFHVVYSLSRALYPEGYRCTGSTGRTKSGKPSSVPRCPSNDHTNDYGSLSRRYDAAHPEDYRADEAEGLSEAESRALRADYVSARQEWIAAQRTYTKTRMHRDGGYALNNRSL